MASSSSSKRSTVVLLLLGVGVIGSAMGFLAFDRIQVDQTPQVTDQPLLGPGVTPPRVALELDTPRRTDTASGAPTTAPRLESETDGSGDAAIATLENEATTPILQGETVDTVAVEPVDPPQGELVAEADQTAGADVPGVGGEDRALRGGAGRVRRRFGEPVEGVFKAFRRGGVGEGFACITLEIDAEDEKEEDVSVSGDMTEAPFGVAVIEGEIGRDARIIEANKAFTDVFGGKKKNAPLAKALPQSAQDELAAEIKRKANAGGAPRAVEAVVGEGANAQHHALFARPVKRRRGSYGVRRTLLYSVDVSERKRMEEDYAQDQKLKAIGHLAGEVAHDFNNLLQVVMGNCEHLMLRHPAGDPAYQELVLIRENAQRAANMTKQLLAYSRKQTLTAKVVSMTDILLDFSRFLDRAVGEKVKLDLVNGRGLPPVKVDRNQLETAIMNLAVNARDAMAPEGGKLTITTKLATADDIKKAALPGLDAQDHLLIEVTDTGPGVPQEIVDRIFDPFFTTKDEGKGTGLGLSTVHGVIGQMGGGIFLDSEEGKGATFKIYLPAFAGEIEEEEDAAAAPPPTADYTGSGRILVVEDEDPVRAFVVATLERSGYEVTAVGDGIDALELFEDGDIDFDLVISDVMMPEVDGPTLVERARAERGLSAGVIFMSGYAESNVREQLDKIEDAGYIQKPFPMAALGAKVKETLSARTAVN